jgi:flagellar biogenesis protein FliO
MGWEIVKLIFCFVIFCVILWGAYAVSKWLASRSTIGFSSKYMKIIDRTQLSKDSFLCIAQIGQRYFLIGTSADGINLLTELSEDDLELLQNNAEYDNPIDSVKNLLYNAVGRVKGKKNGEDNTDFYNIFKSEQDSAVDKLIRESRDKTDRLKRRRSDEDENDES